MQGSYTSIIPGKFYNGSQIAVDEAIGIVSDYYVKIVTVQSTVQLTLTSTVPDTYLIGSVITSSGQANGTISKISGSTITLISFTGIFADGDTLVATGTSAVSTIDTSGV